jgi:hypothetical protein
MYLVVARRPRLGAAARGRDDAESGATTLLEAPLSVADDYMAAGMYIIIYNPLILLFLLLL